MIFYREEKNKFRCGYKGIFAINFGMCSERAWGFILFIYLYIIDFVYKQKIGRDQFFLFTFMRGI